MRSREEIMVGNIPTNWKHSTDKDSLILEVLLDIRDLLEDIRNR